MKPSLTLPDLETRFLPPENWQIKNFINPDTGHEIYYRTAFIDNPKGIIFCLPGLSEYGEKYIETARDLNKAGYNVAIIDWAYQGFSCRLKDDPNKRHSDGYDSDISDLHYLINNEIKSPFPVFIMAHSMGGNIALRYAAQYPDKIKAVATSAPMLSIYAMKYMCGMAGSLFSFFKKIHFSYVYGGHDWHEDNRKGKGEDIFSSDPIRDEVHNAWCLTNPALQIGSPTYKWLAESLRSICILKNKETFHKIKCAILLTAAGKDTLVDNKSIFRAAKFIPKDRLVYFENAKHEILMETDDIRDLFLSETIKLFDEAL